MLLICGTHEGDAIERRADMASELPYTSKDTKYDNAKFRRRTPLKVKPNLCHYIGNCCDDHHLLCRVCFCDVMLASNLKFFVVRVLVIICWFSRSCVCLLMVVYILGTSNVELGFGKYYMLSLWMCCLHYQAPHLSSLA